jgi:hypothetical protein
MSWRSQPKQMKKKKPSYKVGDSYKNNLHLVQRRFPDLYQRMHAARNFRKTDHAIHADQKRTDSIRKTRLLFYGDDDPKTTVKQIVDDWNFKPCDILFCIGMGLGYLPCEAIKKDIGNPRMVVIEPAIQFFEWALHEVDLGPLLTSHRIDLFIGEAINIAGIVDRFQDIIPIGQNKIFVHPHYETIFGQKITTIKQELIERIRAVRDNWYTTRKYGQQMFTNAVANLPSLFAGTPMKNLRDKFKDIPAICVAAGPSLDHAISDLKELHDHVLIIACDSAVNALIKAGIRPHIVVAIDIFETNLDKLKPHFEALRDTVIIYSIESNPDNVRLYLGQRRVAVSAYSKLLLFWLDPTLNLQCKFPAMTSVSHMAIFSALALGADPIVMVGMDLSYSKGKSHSFDSAFFHSLDQKKLVTTYGNKGWLIPSSPQFVADKLLIEKMVGPSSVRFINTSINGSYVAGTEVKRLAEVVDSEAATQLDACDFLDAVDWHPAADEFAASTVIKKLHEQFVVFRQLCSKKKREILDEIDKIEKCPQTKLDPKKLAALETEFDELEEKHHLYKHMIKEIMLGDIEEFLKHKEMLLVNPDGKESNIPFENLKLLARHYEVYEKGMDFQIDQLKSFDHFTTGLIELKQGLDAFPKDEEKHIQLARYFVGKGQLWLARREYETCMATSGNPITPYLELSQAYIKVGLWKPAQELLIKARSVFRDLPALDQLETDIEAGIDGLLDEIKKEWTQGNMHTTRKLLNQYLILCPDDPQALELKKVIRELDEEFSSEWDAGKKEKTADPGMPMRFKQVVQHIKNKNFEQGVGILEGMIEDFPEMSGAVREQVGDIRVLQKDFRSALWNYQQVMKIDPLKIEIKNKVDKIKPKLK